MLGLGDRERFGTCLLILFNRSLVVLRKNDQTVKTDNEEKS